MNLPWLDPGDAFPDASQAWDAAQTSPGLLAAGGALAVEEATATARDRNLGTDLAIAPPNMEGVLIQPGIGLIYHASTASGNSKEDGASTTVEDANNIMPWYGFAAEAKAFEWLFLRLGARQVISRTNVANTETSPKNNETHFSTVTNTVSTGFGVKLMGWDLEIGRAHV